jgi:hypothetical protein
MQEQFLQHKNRQMPQLPLSMQQVPNANLIHEIEGIGNGQFDESNLFLLHIDLLEFLFILGFLCSKGLICRFILHLYVFECILNVEHGGMIHIEERVKNLFFILLFFIQ